MHRAHGVAPMMAGTVARVRAKAKFLARVGGRGRARAGGGVEAEAEVEAQMDSCHVRRMDSSGSAKAGHPSTETDSD